MVIIGEEQSNGYISAQQQNYGPHFQAINGRLRSLGLRTFTPEEIRAQIKQAEIDAYFKNDPDAALSAAKRLGASFILRGLISSQATQERDHPGEPGRREHGLHAPAQQRPDHFGRRRDAQSYAGANVAQMALRSSTSRPTRWWRSSTATIAAMPGFPPAAPRKK